MEEKKKMGIFRESAVSEVRETGRSGCRERWVPGVPEMDLCPQGMSVSWRVLCGGVAKGPWGSSPQVLSAVMD